jgi:hypothetical protein
VDYLRVFRVNLPVRTPPPPVTPPANLCGVVVEVQFGETLASAVPLHLASAVEAHLLMAQQAPAPVLVRVRGFLS